MAEQCPARLVDLADAGSEGDDDLPRCAHLGCGCAPQGPARAGRWPARVACASPRRRASATAAGIRRGAGVARDPRSPQWPASEVRRRRDPRRSPTIATRSASDGREVERRIDPAEHAPTWSARPLAVGRRGAQRTQKVVVDLTRGPDHGGATGDRDLDSRGAQTPRGTLDEDGLAGHVTQGVKASHRGGRHQARGCASARRPDGRHARPRGQHGHRQRHPGQARPRHRRSARR